MILEHSIEILKNNEFMLEDDLAQLVNKISACKFNDYERALLQQLGKEQLGKMVSSYIVMPMLQGYYRIYFHNADRSAILSAIFKHDGENLAEFCIENKCKSDFAIENFIKCDRV